MKWPLDGAHNRHESIELHPHYNNLATIIIVYVCCHSFNLVWADNTNKSTHIADTPERYSFVCADRREFTLIMSKEAKHFMKDAKVAFQKKQFKDAESLCHVSALATFHLIVDGIRIRL